MYPDKYRPDAAEWEKNVKRLQKAVEGVTEKRDALTRDLQGLIDLDVSFAFVKTSFDLVLALAGCPLDPVPDDIACRAKAEAINGLKELERISSSNVSLDQSGLVKKAPELEEIKDKITSLLDITGPDLFSTDKISRKNARYMRKVMRDAVWKYTEWARTSHTEGADAYGDPGDILEGEEEILVSDHMTLPLSQAIDLIETEFLPQCNAELEKYPGDPHLQRQRNFLIRQMQIYREARFIPRRRDIMPHQITGIGTESLAAYTEDGEMMVTVKVPVIYHSGNRYDRLRDFIIAEIINKIGGRGIDAELDAEIRQKREPESGYSGSFFDPKSKLKSYRVFHDLGYRMPFLKRLQDKDELKKMISYGEAGERKTLDRYIQKIIVSDRNLIERVAAVKMLLEGAE